MIRKRLTLPRPALLLLLAPLLLGGCSKDSLGPDNRLALIALGQCKHAEAMVLTDKAVAYGSADHAVRALLLKAAILRDQGDTAGAEALYPAIEAGWQRANGKSLPALRRESTIGLYLDLAGSERHARGLPADCAGVSATGAAGAPSGSGQ